MTTSTDQSLQKATMDKGRNKNEKSCIWVEHGNFYGMGYIDNSEDVTSTDDIKDRLTRCTGNHYIMQLIISFVCKNPGKVFTFGESKQELQFQLEM